MYEGKSRGGLVSDKSGGELGLVISSRSLLYRLLARSWTKEPPSPLSLVANAVSNNGIRFRGPASADALLLFSWWRSAVPPPRAV